MNLDEVTGLLTIIQNRFNQEVDAILELGRTSPKLVLQNMDAIKGLRSLHEQLECLKEDLTDLHCDLRTQTAARKLANRWQKYWRILACRACMGSSSIDHLLNQAFYELVTEPPSEEELDADLEKVVVELEQFEKELEEPRELRAIS